MAEFGDTVKLRETPKADDYNPDARKGSEEGRVMAPSLPNLKVCPLASFTDPSLVLSEIYVITCTATSKMYVGQAVSHKMSCGRYRRHGSHGRFIVHVAESKLNGRKQCLYLNNAIRKHGPKAFTVETIAVCPKDESDHWETVCITWKNTMFPNGYNLKFGGKSFAHTKESRTKVSGGVVKYFDDQRIEKFKDVSIPSDIDPVTLIRPLRREKVHKGWYVVYHGANGIIKSDFGGELLDLDQSYERALAFVRKLQQNVKTSSDSSELTESQLPVNGQSAAKP